MSMMRKTKMLRIGIVLCGAFILYAILFSMKRISFHWMDAGSKEDKNLILQNKENNCGPIALKMIFDHYKIPSTLIEIETRAKINDMGTSMLALKELAEAKGLHAEGWRLTIADLFKADFPVILFVNGDHYIVADSASRDTIFVRDPTFGKFGLQKSTLSEKWKGETLVFNSSKE